MGQLAKCLDREGFLKRAVVKEVALPDGEVVCIRALPAGLLIAGAEDTTSGVFKPDNLLVQSLCDRDGKLLFTGEETDMVMTVDHMTLNILLEAIMDLNGFSSAAKKDMGQAEKN